MLKNIDALDRGFQVTAEKTRKECSDELKELQRFIVGMGIFAREVLNDFFNEKLIQRRKWGNSLLTWCFLESWRSCGHLLFLSYNGLYRSVFYNIRHLLESAVQALYLDSRLREMENISFLEPDKHIDNIFVKLAILREVEDKREYHTLRLIDELQIPYQIPYRKQLTKTYKGISQAIHPTHKQIESTMRDLTSHDKLAATVDCKEIERITTHLRDVYDIFIFLYITYFSEVKDSLKKNSKFVDYVKTYKLYLTSKMLGIKLGKRES